MNLEIADRWLKALNSGEYKHGIGKFRSSENTYCCLGVLCDLYRKQGASMDWISHGSYFSFDGRDGVLPTKVQHWAQINNGGVVKLAGHEALTSLNDKSASYANAVAFLKRNKEAL